jgi:hypothetical protein
MTEKVEEILRNNQILTLPNLQELIHELKEEARRNKLSSEHDRQYYFYDGEINAYCLCLDLIERCMNGNVKKGNRRMKTNGRI